MGSEEARVSRRYADFQSFMADLLKHMDIAPEDGGLSMRLRGDFDGAGILGEYAKVWGVRKWTPLLLAQALSDFKGRIGGSVRVVAVGPDFAELSQTKCEFGEPKNNAHAGNFCAACMSVVASIAGASGMADPDQAPGLECTLADGSRCCDYSLGLVPSG